MRRFNLEQYEPDWLPDQPDVRRVTEAYLQGVRYRGELDQKTCDAIHHAALRQGIWDGVCLGFWLGVGSISVLSLLIGWWTGK